ncbi:beta-hexosaminidase subunit beta-like [Achroia grisella]|uniref:beta-hexosaminidase subunit beta-like n=1 Tax=Achroia grisella TaxID=688607 RepID=UPI0027D3350B|nr:beta-hexosaminidase subunit beta-like [Achroia grisella]
MLRHFIIFVAVGDFFAIGMYVINPGPLYPPTKGEVWPKPQFEKKEYTYFTHNSSFIITPTNYTCEILDKAIERYAFTVRTFHGIARRFKKNRQHIHKQILETSTVNNGHDNHKLERLEIVLTSPCEDLPHLDMDEKYELIIDRISILKTDSIWGALRGLETWSQLFYLTDDYNQLRINKTHIIDFPRYNHRGLLLDTSRHYISVSNILKTLNAMTMNKLNVFHWHIVDDQSFPYQSKKFPDLSAFGAYHSSMIYTHEDIQKILKYATERGIRVLPEFDVPGHTRSWGVAYPDILTKCYNKKKVIGLGPMNPINNATYALLESLFGEVQEWFPDKYLHVGGDEVELNCWNSNPELMDYMVKHNLTTTQLHGLFMQNVIPLLQNKSIPIVWQEVFDEGVPLSRNTIIQVWKSQWIPTMIQVLQHGYRLIFSASWYLDHLKTGGDWTDFYTADPRSMVYNATNNSSLLHNIIGGEACMWGEVVDDVNVLSRVWPRASAVAERLWSNIPVAGYRARTDALDSARHRLEEHTCRMNRRGIAAQPPNGPSVCVTNKH